MKPPLCSIGRQQLAHHEASNSDVHTWLQVMVTEGSLPFKTNYQRNARIGVLPKRQQDSSSPGGNVRWFELDQPFACFHTANAWEEGDIIRLFLCYFKKVGCLMGTCRLVDAVHQLHVCSSLCLLI